MTTKFYVGQIIADKEETTLFFISNIRERNKIIEYFITTIIGEYENTSIWIDEKSINDFKPINDNWKENLIIK